MKRLLPVAALVAAVIVAGTVIASSVISREPIKQAVVDHLAALTGGAVSFSGEPQIRFFPRFGFRLDNVVVASSPGAAEPLVTMDALQGRIELLPLLTGRIKTGRLELVAPRIHLSVDAAGRDNWHLGNSAKVTQSRGKALGRVTIIDGFVSYRNALSGATTELTSVNLAFAWRSLNEPAQATGTAVWRGQNIEASGSLTRPLDFLSDRSSLARITIQSTPLRFSFQGVVSGPSSAQLDGDLSLSAPSLRRALEWTGHGIGDGSTLGAASMTAKANLVGSMIALSGARIELDGNQAIGALNITFDRSRPRVQGTLAFDSLDLSSYLESFRAGLAASAASGPSPIGLPFLTNIDLDLRLSAQQVTVGKARFGRAAASAVDEAGRLTVNINELQAYGGNLQATLEAELADPIVSGTVKASITDVLAHAALADIVGVNALDGTGSGTIEISGKAASWAGLLSTASGSANLRLLNGSMAGIDVSQFSSDADGAPETTASTGAAATPFRSIAGELLIGEGMVRTQSLVAEGPDYAVTLDGSASLTKPAIDAKGTLSIKRAASASNAAGNVEFPFLIGGSWTRPLISPDIDRLLEQKTPHGPTQFGGGDATSVARNP